MQQIINHWITNWRGPQDLRYRSAERIMVQWTSWGKGNALMPTTATHCGER